MLHTPSPLAEPALAAAVRHMIARFYRRHPGACPYQWDEIAVRTRILIVRHRKAAAVARRIGDGL